MVVLNSNPEILLRKRKDRDRKRLEKQEQAIQKQLQQKKKNARKLKKFVRVETLISNYKSTELEKKRIQHITKHQQREQEQDATYGAEDGSENLLFVIRVPDHAKGLTIPRKAKTILRLLRLDTPNTGVFVKENSTTSPLLKLILPYIVAGTPSLASVRQLFQKRACISVLDEETEKPKTVKLDNNLAVEEKFGDDLGLICIEDLFHEIVTLGENFKPVTFWLMPFKLNAPVSGWGPQAKLAKLQYELENKRKVSLAGNAALELIDIDKFIEEQN